MLSLLLHPAYKGFTKTLWIKQFAFDPPFPSDAALFHTSFIVRPKIGEKKGGAALFGRAVPRICAYWASRSLSNKMAFSYPANPSPFTCAMQAMAG